MKSIFLSLFIPACADKNIAITQTVEPQADVDVDGDAFNATEDCNDDDALVNPDAQEICDGVDNNCDGRIDEEELGETPAFPLLVWRFCAMTRAALRVCTMCWILWARYKNTIAR